jgi:hypothetical protein
MTRGCSDHFVEAIPAVKGLPVAARKRLGKVHDDRAYASRAHPAWLRGCGIAARIARHGVKSRERLGRCDRSLNGPSDGFTVS